MFMRILAGLLAGLVLLTQTAAAPVVPVAVTCPVADLVVPISKEVGGNREEPAATVEQNLIKLITSTIAPKSWQGQGGKGTIDYYPLNMSLVIRQTPEVQEKVAGLLARLRREQDTQITVELRFVTLSDEAMSKLGIRDEESGSAGTPAISFLDDTQVSLLLEKLQGDPATNIMQAPKLTCFNGQKATFDVTDKQSFITGVDVVAMGDNKKGFKPKTTTVSTGVQVFVQPAVADHRAVTMNLGVNIARLDSNKVPTHPVVCAIKPEETAQTGEKPVILTQYVQQPRVSSFCVQTTLKIPEGKTALLSGWTHQREVYNETAAPSLARVPYVNQLFRQIKPTRQKEHLLVLVTPRVVIHKEQEEKKPAITADEQEPPVRDTVTDAPIASKAEQIYSNNRSFALAYEVDNVGSSNLAGIDVYFTRDGKSWERYPDPVKPMGSVPVKVASEGRYGFTLVARSGAGLAKAAPKPGDEPHVWVEVDATPPHVELYAPKIDNGVMILTWKAEDRNLADQPIGLEWSGTPDGPWTTMGEGRMANTGKYVWTLPENVPGKIYVRLTVRDEADNIGTAQTLEPVAVDLKVPEIRAVRFRATR